MPFLKPLAQRRSPFRAVTILVVLATMLLAACNGSKDTGGGEGQAPVASEHTPPFDFKVDKITDTPTMPGAALTIKASPDAQKVSDQIAAELSLLYKAGFLDPENWKNGDYASFYDLFDTHSKADAKANEPVLTAGADAGTTYSDIQPGFSHFNVRVLTDEKGKVMTASALVEFRALAKLSAGGDKTLVSKGTYFLDNASGTWTISGFDIDREDADGDTAAGQPAKPGGQNSGGNAGGNGG